MIKFHIIYNMKFMIFYIEFIQLFLVYSTLPMDEASRNMNLNLKDNIDYLGNGVDMENRGQKYYKIKIY